MVVSSVHYWQPDWPASATIAAFSAIQENAPYVKRIVWASGTPALDEIGNPVGHSIVDAVRAAGYTVIDFNPLFSLLSPQRHGADLFPSLLYEEDKRHFMPTVYAAMNQMILQTLCKT